MPQSGDRTPCPQAPKSRDVMHWSPWQGWLWPPSSKDPPEEPKVLQPSAKCPLRTHRGHTGDMWESCPGQGRVVKLWQCCIPTKPCFPKLSWQHLPLSLRLPAFPAASPGKWQHGGCQVGVWGWDAPVPGWQAGPHGPLCPPRLSSCSEGHPSGDGHLLPATAGAMGQACRGSIREESPDPGGGGRRGHQRSSEGWQWPTGLRQGWEHGPSSISAGVFLAGGKPRAWGACRQHCPACSPAWRTAAGFGLGGTLQTTLFHPLHWAGTPSTSPGCSELHPAWP